MPSVRHSDTPEFSHDVRIAIEHAPNHPSIVASKPKRTHLKEEESYEAPGIVSWLPLQFLLTLTIIAQEPE